MICLDKKLSFLADQFTGVYKWLLGQFTNLAEQV